MNVKKFIEASQNISLYRPSPSILHTTNRLGLSTKELLKLDSNENLFLDRKVLQDVLIQAALETDPRLYPQDEEEMLKEKIAEINNIEAAQVVISAGGDQAIELLIHTLSQQGGSVTAITPTFSIYPRVALQSRIKFRESTLEPDFSLNVEKTLKIAEGSDILILCNPNNPTSNQFPKDQVIDLINGFDGPVLVDEAYQEYSCYSLADETASNDNLILLRTFSKAYGLAGLRLGYLITNEVLASTIRERYMMPYPVSNYVMNVGYKILQNQPMINESIMKTKIERKWLSEEINKLGSQCFQSQTNFLLFNNIKPYNDVYMKLRNTGIVVRKLGKVLQYNNCLRVTVAPRSMLLRFVKALEDENK
jgi:histidinol-phosphate aminotransferase